MPKRKREASPEEIINSFGDDERALAVYLRRDPIAFCKHALGFVPHRSQAEFMQLPVWEEMSVMLPWGRQYGKTFIVAAMIAYCLFAFSDFRAYLFGPAEDQTKEILHNVEKFYRRSEVLKRFVKTKPTDNTFYVGGDEWGSYVELVKIGPEGKLGRSRSTSGKGLIVLEEFNVMGSPDVVKQTLTPILRSGGGEIIISSPGDPGGEMDRIRKLWDEASKANNKYRVIYCPKDALYDFMPQEKADAFIEKCRLEYPDWMFRREILGEWVSPANTWFDSEDLKRCVLPKPVQYNARDQFAWAIDFGGRGRSALVVTVARYCPSLQRLEVVDLLQFYHDKENNNYHRDTKGAEIITGKDKWGQIEDILLDLRDHYPPVWVGVDPATENSLSGRLEHTYHFPIEPILIGGYQKKLALYTALQAGIRAQRIVWSHKAITDQMQQFCPRPKDNGTWEFPTANTDIVVTLVNLYQYLGRVEVTPFEVATGNRDKSATRQGGVMALW